MEGGGSARVRTVSEPSHSFLPQRALLLQQPQETRGRIAHDVEALEIAVIGPQWQVERAG